MKNKVVITVLPMICIASVCFNIYQFNMLNASRQELSEAQAQLDNMTNSYADLESQLMAMQEELDTLNTSISDKQSELDSLAKENGELLSSISELESIVNVVEDDTDSEDEADSTDVADTTTSVKSTETTQANNQTTTSTASTTTNAQNNLQAETLQRLASMGITNTAGMGSYSEVGNSTFSTGAVWE